eukprot:scaffold52765_cov22-Tisochrysis_lutea.AAC.1
MQVPCRCRCMPVPRSSISGFAMKKTLAHLLSKYVSVECATLPTAFTILALPGCCVPRAIPPLTHDVLIFLIRMRALPKERALPLCYPEIHRSNIHKGRVSSYYACSCCAWQVLREMFAGLELLERPPML